MFSTNALRTWSNWITLSFGIYIGQPPVDLRNCDKEERFSAAKVWSDFMTCSLFRGTSFFTAQFGCFVGFFLNFWRIHPFELPFLEHLLILMFYCCIFKDSTNRPNNRSKLVNASINEDILVCISFLKVLRLVHSSRKLSDATVLGGLRFGAGRTLLFNWHQPTSIRSGKCLGRVQFAEEFLWTEKTSETTASTPPRSSPSTPPSLTPSPPSSPPSPTSKPWSEVFSSYMLHSI